MIGNVGSARRFAPSPSSVLSIPFMLLSGVWAAVFAFIALDAIGDVSVGRAVLSSLVALPYLVQYHCIAVAGASSLVYLALFLFWQGGAKRVRAGLISGVSPIAPLFLGLDVAVMPYLFGDPLSTSRAALRPFPFAPDCGDMRVLLWGALPGCLLLACAESSLLASALSLPILGVAVADLWLHRA